MEKLLSRNKEAYIAFLDLQAAFDTIPREEIWKALQKLGATKNLIEKIQSIYETVKGRVQIGEGQSEEIKMEKGVKQGDSLSPLLFIIVMDQILKQCKRTARCKVGHYKMRPIYVQSLIYADDIALIVSNKEELQKAVTEWASAMKDRGIRINVKKSKVMVITKNKNREHLNITWEEEQLEQVERF